MGRHKRGQILRLLRKDQAALALHIHELHGDAFDFAVFNQPLHQFSARIISVVLIIIEVLDFNHRRLRQQELALYGQQGSCHDQKLTGNVQLQFLHSLQIFHVLLGNLADRNVLDVDFRFVNQVQEQIERTFERLQLIQYSHAISSC
ncbi:hypothetical protein D3C73_1094480 [compost metagenome]